MRKRRPPSLPLCSPLSTLLDPFSLSLLLLAIPRRDDISLHSVVDGIGRESRSHDALVPRTDRAIRVVAANALFWGRRAREGSAHSCAKNSATPCARHPPARKRTRMIDPCFFILRE